MTRDDVKDVLVQAIVNAAGIKGTALVSRPEVISVLRFLDSDLPDMLEELVEEKRIVEVEYTLPPDHIQVKSFYLPGEAVILNS